MWPRGYTWKGHFGKIRFSQFTELDNWVITDGEGEIGRGFEDFGNKTTMSKFNRHG